MYSSQYFNFNMLQLIEYEQKFLKNSFRKRRNIHFFVLLFKLSEKFLLSKSKPFFSCLINYQKP